MIRHLRTTVNPLALAVAAALTLSACSDSSTTIQPPSTTTAEANAGVLADETDVPAGSQPDNTPVNTQQTTTVAEPSDDDAETNVNPTTTSNETVQPPASNNAEPLTPLAQSTLTEAPGPDDEPLLITRPVSSISNYPIVEDPARIIKPVSRFALTVDDFNAGTPAPIITAPEGFDTSTNAAPYFEGISNREVFAGQTLEVLYRPLDDDGGLPGMFPNELPESAQFVDNRDGTKTLRWVPLQGDIGVSSFTVTAVDSEAPLYRSEQTILLNILEPDDPSSIPNFPPVVNQVLPHTVRVGDSVVFELKGSDRNSTLPNVEILSSPPGSIVTPHYIDDDITVLQFVPTEPGLINIDVVARDADDPSLTGSRTVSVTVEAREEFVLPGQRLRDLAGARNFLIGFASLQGFYHRPDGQLYSDLAGAEFNIVSTENAMKWDFINPEPGTYRWADADNTVAFAQHHNQVVHGHPMVWHRQLPLWVRESDPEELETHMREFIDRLATRYADDVAIWDVVNEPISDEGGFRDSIWMNAMGEDYIDIAFRQAKESDPDGILLLNEYDIAWDTPKTETLFPLLESLQARGTPIDGVGFQMHISSEFNDYDEVIRNFQRVADMGLDIYITELDVAIWNNNTGYDQQADVYERVLDICLNQPACKALQLWGFTDQYSWRRPQTPLMLDATYKAKPAYLALQRRLGN